MNELNPTRNRILDSAERLFASEGFRGASMRAITGDAGVNLAAVNYHFGSKERLLEAVLERRLHPLNSVRRQRLETVRVRARLQGVRPGVLEIVRAFVEPTILFRDSSPGCGDFVTLVGRILAEPDGTGREIFLRYMAPLLRRLADLFAEALPETPPDVLQWRISFMVGTMSHTMRHPDGIPGTLEPRVSPGRLADLLVNFVAAGMEAP